MRETHNNSKWITRTQVCTNAGSFNVALLRSSTESWEVQVSFIPSPFVLMRTTPQKKADPCQLHHLCRFFEMKLPAFVVQHRWTVDKTAILNFIVRSHLWFRTISALLYHPTGNAVQSASPPLSQQFWIYLRLHTSLLHTPLWRS